MDARGEGIEVVYQDLALCDNLTAAANVFLGREMRKKMGVLKVLDYRSMYERRFAVRRAQVGDPAARSGQADVGRPAPGRDRPHAAVGGQDRADGRADRRDQRAPGAPRCWIWIRRLRDQAIAVILISHRMPDVFAVRPHRGPAPRPQGRREGDRRQLARGSDRADHRGHPGRVRKRPCPSSVAIEDVTGLSERTLFQRTLANQAFWVTVAVALICLATAYQELNTFPTLGNFFNITRNFAGIGIMALA